MEKLLSQIKRWGAWKAPPRDAWEFERCGDCQSEAWGMKKSETKERGYWDFERGSDEMILILNQCYVLCIKCDHMCNCIYLRWWRQDVASSRVCGNVGFACKTRSKRDGGDSKNEVGLKHYKSRLKRGHSRSLMMKTRSLMMKKCRNLKNEIKTRWGDSINLRYCSHIINKSRLSYIFETTCVRTRI